MRIAWLKTELLHPVDRGGRIRTFSMLRALKREHHITYAALDDGRGPADAHVRAEEYAHEVVTFPHRDPPRRSVAFALNVARNLASPLPYSGWRYQSTAMQAWIEQVDAAGMHDVIVSDFLFPAVNLRGRRKTPTVIFQHNVESVIWRRLAETARYPASTYYRLQHERMVAFEGAECRAVDGVVTVSDEDAQAMHRLYGVRDAEAVPTGVDTAFFRPCGGGPREPGHVVFLGAMDWLPNEDGIAHFLDAVMPALRQAHPGVRLSIVGRNPSAHLRARAAQEPDVAITGTVPDVRPHLERASVVIVPLRIGGGTRIKIFEAMAMEAPVVSTTIGAEGLPVQDGEHLVIADDPGAMARAIARLLVDQPAAQALGRRAAALVRTRYSWDHAAQEFVRLCERAIDRRQTPVPSLTPQGAHPSS